MVVSRVETVLIVACAKGGVIGVNNTLPWRLPEDLAHFKRHTTGHCIIMGRKTFESIGRALPNRRSIVVTRQSATTSLRSIAGVECADSLEAALALSQNPAPSLAQGLLTMTRTEYPRSPVFIIGGAQLYKQAIQHVQRIELTEIDLEIPGDSFFPAIDPEIWEMSEGGETLQSSAGLSYRFVTYRRSNRCPS